MNRRVTWPSKHGRPVIQIELSLPNGHSTTRSLLADTGAGTSNSDFELILDEMDSLLCDGVAAFPVKLHGA